MTSWEELNKRLDDPEFQKQFEQAAQEAQKPEKASAPAKGGKEAPADDAAKNVVSDEEALAAAKSGGKEGAAAATVWKDGEGKIHVEHRTREEQRQFAEDVASGKKELPEGAKFVGSDGKGHWLKPIPVTENDAVTSVNYNHEIEKIAKEEHIQGGVVSIVDKDGHVIDHKAVKDHAEFEAYVKAHKLGDDQKIIVGSIDEKGEHHTAAVSKAGEAGRGELLQKGAEAEEEAKKDPKKSYLDTLFEKAMSGEMGEMGMILAACIALFAGDKLGGQQQEHDQQQDKTGIPMGGAPDGRATATSANRDLQVENVAYHDGGDGKEVITLNRGMSADPNAPDMKRLADQLKIPEDEREDFAKAVGEAMGSAKSIAGGKVNIQLNIDEFETELKAPPTPATSGGRSAAAAER